MTMIDLYDLFSNHSAPFLKKKDVQAYRLKAPETIETVEQNIDEYYQTLQDRGLGQGKRNPGLDPFSTPGFEWGSAKPCSHR